MEGTDLKVRKLEDLIAIQESNQRQGAELIGVIVTWIVKQGLQVRRDDLESIAAKHGLPDRFLPSPISTSTAFTRAVRKVKLELDKDLMLRTIAKNTTDENTTLGLVREEIDTTDEELKYQQISRIVYVKDKGGFFGYPHHSIVESLNKWLDIYGQHTSEDILKILRNLTAETGISIREDNGGAYYVAIAHQHLVDAAEKVVTEIDGRNRLYQIPITATVKGNYNLTELATQDLKREIESIQDELGKLISSDKTQPETLEKRLTTLSQMEKRISTFGSTLNFESADLLLAVKQMQTDVLVMSKHLRNVKLGIAEELGVAKN